MSFISDAYAQAAKGTTTADNPLMNLLPLILILGVFYFFLIRPQQKKIKEHEAVLSNMKIGDEVITGGGIVGKVKKIEEDSNIVHIEIAKDVVVRVNKTTIIEILANSKAANSTVKSDQQTKNEKRDKQKKASA